MTVRRRRKLKKLRGRRTHGRGCVKRGRGSGERAGRGTSGGHKQKWSYVLRYMPDYFGKHGFVRHNREEVLALNVGDIDEIIEKLAEDGVASVEGSVYKVDLSKLGVSKVLGKGKVTRPMEVSAEAFSESAKKKLEEAGGKAVSGEGDGGASEAEV